MRGEHREVDSCAWCVIWIWRVGSNAVNDLTQEAVHQNLSIGLKRERSFADGECVGVRYQRFELRLVLVGEDDLRDRAVFLWAE